MTTEDQETRFLKAARQVLDQDTVDLDDATVARLRRIRYAALEKITPEGRAWWRRWRLPAAALVTASLIAVVTVIQTRTPGELKTATPIEDMEILAADEQLDLYADFDFYTWMAEEQRNAG